MKFIYLLPKRKASTQKILTIETFGSYIWLQVSIKVVTLFIHVNHHPMATHISTLRTETHNKDFSHVKWDCTRTHIHILYVRSMGNVLNEMNTYVRVCVRHNHCFGVKEKKNVLGWWYTFGIDNINDVYSYWNVCKFCMSITRTEIPKIKRANNVSSQWILLWWMIQIEFDWMKYVKFIRRNPFKRLILSKSTGWECNCLSLFK